jgi:hypothetical protein
MFYIKFFEKKFVASLYIQILHIETYTDDEKTSFLLNKPPSHTDTLACSKLLKLTPSSADAAAQHPYQRAAPAKKSLMLACRLATNSAAATKVESGSLPGPGTVNANSNNPTLRDTFPGSIHAHPPRKPDAPPCSLAVHGSDTCYNT